jgi:hypothetical protein
VDCLDEFFYNLSRSSAGNAIWKADSVADFFGCLAGEQPSRKAAYPEMAGGLNLRLFTSAHLVQGLAGKVGGGGLAKTKTKCGQCIPFYLPPIGLATNHFDTPPNAPWRALARRRDRAGSAPNNPGRRLAKAAD